MAMNTHHLTLGTLNDFLSGDEITDTHDERYRQKIARLLVLEKNFVKEDIKAGIKLKVSASGKNAILTVDFLVFIHGEAQMVVKYGPGSIITRHRPALAVSRLVAAHQIPVVVVTNGEQADILSGSTGRLIGTGFENIPDRAELARLCGQEETRLISSRQQELEARILFAFEVDGSCPCDSDICRIE